MTPVPGPGGTTTVVVHPDKDVLAAAVAARLLVALTDVQAARGTASVVLTGGGIGTASLAAVAASPLRAGVDWSRVDVWWGDERFVAADSPERNDVGARAALLDALALDPARVHAMPALGGPAGDDPDVAAEAYVRELAAAAPEGRSAPAFDVLMLGVGPDGHVASLFPELPGLVDDRPAFAVHGSPKPPPTRTTLSFGVIRGAREVWLLAAGAEKADAVAMALSGAGERQVPAAGVTGTHATRWLLDEAAAGALGP